MQRLSGEQFDHALDVLGLQAGDGVLAHSALQYLGQPQGGVGMILDVLAARLGIDLSTAPNTVKPRGTLVVPTFNFEFAQGTPYDPKTTHSKGMGVFSEFVRQHPAAQRTTHPMQSLAAIGYYAADLAGRETPSAFDPGSAFERMLELDFKILLLGADVQAISLLHYSEQRLNVPYRYWKDFSGQVHTPQGWQIRTCRMFVRDLKLDPRIELYPVQAFLEKRGQWRSAPLNYGKLSLCRMADFVIAMDEFLTKDAWSLVINRPTSARSGSQKPARI